MAQDLFFLSYHITNLKSLSAALLVDDSAYDNPTMKEKNVPVLNENRSDNLNTTVASSLHPTSYHHQSDILVTKEPDKIQDYQSHDNSSSISSSVSISGYGNRNPRLLLPETDIPFRKVSALAALCPTNVNSTPSKQVTLSTPSNVSINLNGKKQCQFTDDLWLNFSTMI